MNNKKYGFISDWIYIYKQYVSKNTLDKDLKIQVNIVDNGVDKTETIPIYSIDKDQNNNEIAIIPRYCDYGKYLLENNYLIDNRTNGADINIQLNTKPRDSYQVNAINAILCNDNGIICAKTAFGKTYVAINAICQLKKKALIFVHKIELAKQWKEDIIKYTNLTEDDIQIFKGSDFQIDKPITITTVQNIGAKIRLNNVDIRQLFYKENFGITIFDECHTSIGPLVNSQSTRWTFSKKIYGLSATPFRGDQYDKVIKYLIGDIIYSDNRKMIPVYVSFAPISVEIPNKTKYYLSMAQKQYTIRYNKWLMKQDVYTDYCANIILSLIKSNKKILAVAALKDLLEVIYNKTYSLLGDNNLSVDKIRLVHGTSSSKLDNIRNMNDDEIDNFNCIFSTNKFFSEGLSINWLDTIVYITAPSTKSLSSIPQLVGRIVREYKNKKFVNVIDIYNNQLDIEVKRMNSRINAYGQLNYNFINSNINSNNIDKYIEDILKIANNNTINL